MLKIKDNVDLKELEKFGFEYDDYLEEYVKSINSLKTKGMFVPYVHTGELFIKKDRTIYDKISNNYWNVENEHKEAIDKIIHDLIQAGLVEKVEDK